MSSLIGILFLIFIIALLFVLGFTVIVTGSYLFDDKEKEFSIKSLVDYHKVNIAQFRQESRSTKIAVGAACMFAGIVAIVLFSLLMMLAKVIGGAVV